MSYFLPPTIKDNLHFGTVIPAHPLALHADSTLDECRQRRLTRYYLACGVGGLAVGVHTTQFEIRDPSVRLLERVLQLAKEEVDHAGLTDRIILVAGIVGPLEQAVEEAKLARRLGYHLGLLSNGGLGYWTNDELIKRAKAVAEELPVFGFYLQPAVGGRILDYDFWYRFAAISNVHAIKVAPFNRYQTLEVMRAVCASPRREDIAMYTGNDDHILGDLLTKYQFDIDGQEVEKRFVGGLLGHWAVWTRKAVQLLAQVKHCLGHNNRDLDSLLAKGIGVTDMNAVIFDASNQFKGCIPGIHEVLRRQGLLEGTWCLNPQEILSLGQSEAIDRVYAMYPELTDDEFVQEFLEKDAY
ncbi:MAG: dihydrodipicolinate synthase family protein [Saprospiraceae bacterium]|nr:dihydrodipicolinate synthase family protein [Saprospiraceae bacterium]